MSSARLLTSEDKMNDCLTVSDSLERLQTSFGSDIVLSPLEDARVVIDELNVQYAVVAMLIEQLEHYVDSDDIMYWIQEIVEEME